jgi:hypothetical protein
VGPPNVVNAQFAVGIEDGEELIVANELGIYILDGDFEIKFIVFDVLAIPVEVSHGEIADDGNHSVACEEISFSIGGGRYSVEFTVLLPDKLQYLLATCLCLLPSWSASLNIDAAVGEAISKGVGMEVLNIQYVAMLPEGDKFLDLLGLVGSVDAFGVGVDDALVVGIKGDAADG